MRETGQLLHAQRPYVVPHQTLPSEASPGARSGDSVQIVLLVAKSILQEQSIGQRKFLRCCLLRVWSAFSFAFHRRRCEGDGEDGVDEGFPEYTEPAEGRLSGEEVDLEDFVGGHGSVEHGDAEEYVSQVQPDAADAWQTRGVVVGPETYGEGVPDEA